MFLRRVEEGFAWVVWLGGRWVCVGAFAWSIGAWLEKCCLFGSRGQKGARYMTMTVA